MLSRQGRPAPDLVRRVTRELPGSQSTRDEFWRCAGLAARRRPSGRDSPDPSGRAGVVRSSWDDTASAGVAVPSCLSPTEGAVYAGLVHAHGRPVATRVPGAAD